MHTVSIALPHLMQIVPVTHQRSADLANLMNHVCARSASAPDPDLPIMSCMRRYP